tara:strand:+ start:3409 stop:4239 length:831 start_codon:yes stop_codon:yes gene_type:complete
MVKKIEFIAEIGINHNGSLDLAKKHIEKAKEAGADVAKFQTYFTESRTKKGSPIFEILKKCELRPEDFNELKVFCNELDIQFCSTPFCLKSAKVLYDLNCPTLKIASFHLSNLGLIDDLINNSNAKRLLISTGVSSISEIISVNQIYDQCNKIDKPELIFLHCISKYPILKENDNHLENIKFISRITGKKVGFSDHSIGYNAAIIATALGAEVIEKHFTIDNNIEGADHSMSANPKIFKKLVNQCRLTLDYLGNQRGNNPFDCEKEIIQYRVSSEK